VDNFNLDDNKVTSWTRSVTIEYKKFKIVIDQGLIQSGFQVTIDGVKSPPGSSKDNGNIEVSLLGLFVKVQIKSIGLSVEWDGAARAITMLDGRWGTYVEGLCGNFNG
ncbi:unnamed protein product, partial [Owenia fusiformis]